MNRRGFLQTAVAAVVSLLVPRSAAPEVTAQQDRVLVKYTVDTGLKPGYFYAPYRPVVRPPVILDADSFVPTKGVLTRYGKKYIDQSLYATLRISHFA